MKRLCKDWSVMQLPEEYHPIFFKPIIDENGRTKMIVENIFCVCSYNPNSFLTMEFTFFDYCYVNFVRRYHIESANAYQAVPSSAISGATLSAKCPSFAAK